MSASSESVSMAGFSSDELRELEPSWKPSLEYSESESRAICGSETFSA